VFDALASANLTTSATLAGAANVATNPGGAALAPSQPIVNINLHIHLPENKSRRDYETIIEDIGRYIFGRVNGDRRE
jgi:hypothetical protein